jgi:ribonuclease R
MEYDEIMLERRNKILEFIGHKEYIPMKANELWVILDVPVQDREVFETMLSDLVKEGKLLKTKKEKFMLPERLNMVSGIFKSNQKGFGFVILDDAEKEDIFISPENLNGAMHKDKVLCRITRIADKNHRAEGEIIQVLEKGINDIVGTYEEAKGFGFVVADDKKIAQDIYIPRGKNKGAVTGHKVVVEVTKWPQEKRNPEGVVTEILGHVNDPGIDILSIIRQFELPTDFPEEVYTQIEAISQEVQPKDMEGRLDLREVQMVTIDGEDAKDLDDAISLEVLPNGNFNLGVHIADVTNYVKEGTPLDKEAYKRGTSVYLVDRVIPMLPHKLSNGICSLNAGVDRLALSCMMEIDNKGTVVGHKIAETIIKIDRRMTYTAVKKILVDNDEELINEYTDFIPFFKLMEQLCSILRKKRTKRGAIDFDFPEAKIILDATGKPTEIKPYERNLATRIIEEFMLVCNETIAEVYFWQSMHFVYRSHGIPNEEKIQQLADFIANFGYFIKGSTTEVHPKAIQKVLDEVEGKPEEHVISKVVLRAMKQARYTATNDGHFGLAAKYYCHFTSPIRRYPDLQIHRIIKENLRGAINAKREASLKKRMPEVSKQCSIRERIAEEAERETDQLKKVEFMADKIGQIFDGIISGVTSWGVYVELPNTVEGLVHVTAMDDDYYIYDQGHLLFRGEHTNKEYRLGDKVKVQLMKTSLAEKTIDFSFFNEE